MFRTSVRLAFITAAAASAVVLGGGLAAAAPTLTADTTEEGSIAVGSNPTGEQWTCVLVGSAEQAGSRFDMARAGESRGGFAAGSTVTAGCLNNQTFAITVVTGVTSLDDED